MPPPLDLFCPLVRRWFQGSFAEPTAIQAAAWPRIAAGEHLLVSAPTGTGKTLSAFLWGLDRLFSGAWSTGALRVLYISPLKALGNDIRRNLLTPLEEIRGYDDAQALPQIGVQVRSGDTPQNERRRMLRAPPEILITTPESLNILLTSAGGRSLFGGLTTVILDEVHAVVGSKRGVHLITAVERLAQLNGEFQRIALSATVQPRQRVAQWVGGWRPGTTAGERSFERRQVAVVAPESRKEIRIDVRVPARPGAAEPGEPDSQWRTLSAELRRIVLRNRSTLVFCNSRRMVEKLTRLINEGQAEPLAYSHHGSLSHELRAVVETRLKAGELKALVATNSLELGIDVGSIDEVVLVQAPPSIASAVQRVGRSGHGVGEVSRGILYTLHQRGLLEAAVVAEAATAGAIEPLLPISNALDVLAQVILSMTVTREWPVDELFAAVRCADPYHDLPRSHFDLVIDMLCGRFASSRLRPIKTMLSRDGITDTVSARPGVARLLFQAGGTIADRGYYKLRVEGSGALIGELDEEFVWERSVGDSFTLGVQSWRVESISHNDVFATPAAASSAMAPFWRAEERDRSFHFASRCAELLSWIADNLESPQLRRQLARRCHLEPRAADELVRMVREQLAATGTLPHRWQVVEEHLRSTRGRSGERQVVLHTLWGGRVNRPLSLALAEAWRQRHGLSPAVAHDDSCIMLSVPAKLVPRDLLAMIRPEELETLLHEKLTGSGFFGARFREAAGCALLLPRAGFDRRTPLWLHRQRAKELLAEVSAHDDFPLIVEAWRACLNDHFEIEILKEQLQLVREGRIAVQRVYSDNPSPMAAHVLWKQTNELMYEDDTPEGGPGAGLRADLLREVANSSVLRPRIPTAIVHQLQSRLNRTAPGYAPRPGRDLADWVGERVLVPDDEWRQLSEAVARDHDLTPEEVEQSADSSLVRVVTGPSGSSSFVCRFDQVARLAAALGLTASDFELLSVGTGTPIEAPDAAPGADPRWGFSQLLGEWLRSSGPVTRARLSFVFGCSPEELDEAVVELADEGLIVEDLISENASGAEVCDRENLERLLRMLRAAARPTAHPVATELLPLHLAIHQGLGLTHATPRDLQSSLEPLFGFAAAAGLWETELLPARLEPYFGAWIDSLLGDSELRWVGCGERRLCFVLHDDRELLGDTSATPRHEIFPQSWGRYPFDQLVRHSGRDSAALSEALWSEVWAGRASADSLAPLRQGLAANFRPPAAPAAGPGGRSHRRLRLARWSADRPFQGHWFPLPEVAEPEDLLAARELELDRARLVLDRYGVVFRELLARELPALRWGAVFRGLRLLELSGEILAGRFFDGVQGLQFATHEAARRLFAGLDEERVWWCNATDPASPCGLAPSGLQSGLPRRVSSAHLVFHGRRLVLVSEAGGSRLRVTADPDHPRMSDYLDLIAIRMSRDVEPERHLDVDEINGAPAASSPYRDALDSRFHVTRVRTSSLRLSRQY